LSLNVLVRKEIADRVSFRIGYASWLFYLSLFKSLLVREFFPTVVRYLALQVSWRETGYTSKPPVVIIMPRADIRY